ncbi:MAG: RNA polymerase subunit sigma [Verrucomicrobiales bacterium]|nr:RNA polymerase subunit sigma [Verrucomicrobiales bacterium]
MTEPGDITQRLQRIGDGDAAAAAELIPLLYDELRRLAAARLSKEPEGQTLQATALVHEAYLRLLGADPARPWNSRGHFFGAAAEAMRRILVENARRKAAQKRGGAWERVTWTDHDLPVASTDDHILGVHEALNRLEREDPQAAALVKLRFFGGLTGQEAAAALGLAERSATRLWAFARAWLYRELGSAS